MPEKKEEKEFVDLHEDIYVLEASYLKRIAFADGFLRTAGVQIDARCAYAASAQQINYAAEKIPYFSDIYPDEKQVSVLRMLLADGILRQIRLLDADMQEELQVYWANLYFGGVDVEKMDEDQLKYGKLLMKCSNTAFEAMDMESSIPEPGQSSKYWDRMIEVADALKGLNALGHLYG